MPRQVILNEINAGADRVWQLLTDCKEFEFWAPNVRELTMEPDVLKVDTIRRFRLDMSGTIETLETRITHLTPGEMYAEIPVGGSLKLHEKTEHLKMIYRVEVVDEKMCNFIFTVDYEMKGFLNKMLEKVVMGTFVATFRLWFERLKTYAETGRVV
jgi:hypothetical protein